MTVMLIFLAFISSLLIYFIVARKAANNTLTHPDQFFLSSNSYDSGQFATAQIGYNLQMSTIFPFFLFAFSGMGWLAIWNTISYAIGIILLIIFLPQFKKRNINLIGSSKTIHGFIAKIHSKPSLRRLTAWLSFIGFVGLTIFEIVWGARVLKILFNDDNVYYFTILIITVYLILYLSIGGQRGTYNTAQYQLVISYFGIHAAVSWAVFNPAIDYTKFGTIGLVMPITILLSIIMFFRRLKIKGGKVLNALILLSLIIMIASIMSNKSFYHLYEFKDFNSTIKSVFNNHENILPLLAFGLLPICFQFVDMSNWQRMVAVETDGNLIKKIKSGLGQFLIESPLSWLFPVILGLCASQMFSNSETDVWDLFLKTIFSQTGFVNTIVSMLVIAGITSIFLSTADGLMIAVGYSYAYDIDKKSSKLIDNKAEHIWTNEETMYVVAKGKKAMGWSLALIALLFIIIDIFFKRGSDFIGIFLSFFTPMISFAPSILIPSIFNKRSSGTASAISIIVPSLCGVGGGIYSIFVGGDWQWIPIIVAVCLSWIIYLVGLLFKRINVN